jgi:hypothetical protein
VLRFLERKSFDRILDDSILLCHLLEKKAFLRSVQKIYYTLLPPTAALGKIGKSKAERNQHFVEKSKNRLFIREVRPFCF